MLAKKLKIQNIKKQREFIKTQLEKVSELNTDGDISYTYIGYIFPEVKEYFVKEGFKINQYMSDFIAAFTNGKPIYLFTIKDDVVLSDEELDEVEKIETPNERLDKMFEEIRKNIDLDAPLNREYLKMVAKIHGIKLPPSFYIDDDDNGEDGEDSEHSAMFDFLSLMGKYGNKTSEGIDDNYEDEP